jgi:hypothetical protein
LLSILTPRRKPIALAPTTRTTPQLSSVENLLRGVQEKGHNGLRALFKDYSFVGCVNENLALVQHQTELFLCNVSVLRYLPFAFSIFPLISFFFIMILFYFIIIFLFFFIFIYWFYFEFPLVFLLNLFGCLFTLIPVSSIARSSCIKKHCTNLANSHRLNSHRRPLYALYACSPWTVLPLVSSSLSFLLFWVSLKLVSSVWAFFSFWSLLYLFFPFNSAHFVHLFISFGLFVCYSSVW